MRTARFQTNFTVPPQHKDNMLSALRRIGIKNPEGITHISPRKKIDSIVVPSSNDYLKLGILNVKKRLNNNKGKSGKFSITSIKRTATIISARNKPFDLIARVPLSSKDFDKLIETVYNMLYEVDYPYISHLRNIYINDAFLPKPPIKNHIWDSVVPVQTTIVRIGVPETTRGGEIKTHVEKSI